MPPEAEAIFTTIIPSTKSLTIGFFGYLIPATIGLIIAVWAIKWGWSSIIGIMKSDGKPVTFGSPLGYHGSEPNMDLENGRAMFTNETGSGYSLSLYQNDDEFYGSLQEGLNDFGKYANEESYKIHLRSYFRGSDYLDSDDYNLQNNTWKKTATGKRILFDDENNFFGSLQDKWESPTYKLKDTDGFTL